MLAISLNPIDWVTDAASSVVDGAVDAAFNFLAGWITDALSWLAGEIVDRIVSAGAADVADGLFEPGGPANVIYWLGLVSVVAGVSLQVTSTMWRRDAGMAQMTETLLDLPVTVVVMFALPTVGVTILRICDLAAAEIGQHAFAAGFGESFDLDVGMPGFMRTIVGILMVLVLIVLYVVQLVRYALRSLVTGSLAGMFDAPTNVTIDPGSPGLIIDVSAAGGDDELLQLSMLAGLRAVRQLRATGGRRTLLFADETWRLATTSQTVRFLQHSWKLGRQTGTSNWAMIHRFSDLAAQTDDGTALSKVTRALVADSGTHILFRHGKREDAETTANELGLPESAVKVLQLLRIHRALVHCGGRLAVEAAFTPDLAELAWTNQAMGRTG